MQLKRYQAYVHDLNSKNKPTHVDVELTFKGAPTTIKMCDCSAYMSGMDSFGDVAGIAAQVREDLGNIANTGLEVTVLQDTLDGSIDIFRTRDNVLLFSMEAEHIEGASWVEKYNDMEG